MKYLLDTATFLWFYFGEEKRFSPKTLKILEMTSNQLYFSTVSSWEIAIKYSMGKLVLKEEPKHLIPSALLKLGIRILPISLTHTLLVAQLPFHHKDPFDRLLVSQSQIEKLTLISPDNLLKKYPVRIIW